MPNRNRHRNKRGGNAQRPGHTPSRSPSAATKSAEVSAESLERLDASAPAASADSVVQNESAEVPSSRPIEAAAEPAAEPSPPPTTRPATSAKSSQRNLPDPGARREYRQRVASPGEAPAQQMGPATGRPKQNGRYPAPGPSPSQTPAPPEQRENRNGRLPTPRPSERPVERPYNGRDDTRGQAEEDTELAHTPIPPREFSERERLTQRPEIRGEVGALIDDLRGIFQRDRAVASLPNCARCGVCYHYFVTDELEYRETEGYYVCANCAKLLGSARLPMIRRQQR